MPLRDPYAAFMASTNLEARIVCEMLRDEGIEAELIEDVAQLGLWQGGSPAELFKPQVWIEKDDRDKAKPILDDYEQSLAGRKRTAAEGPIEVTCEECGAKSTFPPEMNGTTQNCPECSAYIDVGNLVDIEGWDETEGEEG